MMSEKDSIVISKQEVLDFARKIYQEACCGYIDLQESTCASMVERLFEKIFKKTEQNPSSSVLTTSDIVYTSVVSGSSSLTLSTSINNWIVSSDPYSNYYGNSVPGQTITSNTLPSQNQNNQQQLTLFEEEHYSSIDSDEENNSSNEGHVFFDETL